MNYELHGWIQLSLATLMFLRVGPSFIKTPTLLYGGFLVMGAGFALGGISMLMNVRGEYDLLVLLITGAGFLMAGLASHRGASAKPPAPGQDE